DGRIPSEVTRRLLRIVSPGEAVFPDRMTPTIPDRSSRRRSYDNARRQPNRIGIQLAVDTLIPAQKASRRDSAQTSQWLERRHAAIRTLLALRPPIGSAAISERTRRVQHRQ